MQHPDTYLVKMVDGPDGPLTKHQYIDVREVKRARDACKKSISTCLTPKVVYTDDKSHAKYGHADDKLGLDNPIRMPVAFMLEVASGKSAADFLSETAPGKSIPRRFTGVKINLNLNYDVKVGGDTDCYLEVSYTDQEVSWNMDPQMHDPIYVTKPTSTWGSNPNPQNLRTYSEILNKGILVSIKAKGKVRERDCTCCYCAAISTRTSVAP
jgi:hypothetical protein